MRSDRRPRLDHIPKVESFVDEGDPVIVTNVSGDTVSGTFIRFGDKVVGEYPANWTDEYDRLLDVWESRGVKEDERVVYVEVGDREYAYPISRVRMKPIESVDAIGPSRASTLRNKGYTNRLHLIQASEDELANILGTKTAMKIKSDVGDGHDGLDIDADSVEGVQECPVDGCLQTFEENELYEHMIGVHGWYTEELESGEST